MSAFESNGDVGRQHLEVINHVYEMMHDPTMFEKFAEKLANLMDQGQNMDGIESALENSANLSLRLGAAPEVEISRDIGVVVLGVDSSNRVCHVPDLGKNWMGAKFVGNENGIGWIDTIDKTRNIAHVLEFDGQKHLPVHSALKEGMKTGQIKKLLVVHQFSLSESALNALEQLYELTPAEIRLCKLIAENKTLKEAAAESKVKISTPRSQLKSIFSKMGVKSQTELVRVLTQISAASAIHEFSQANKITMEPDWKNGLVSVQTLHCKTRYGTQLTYSKFGDPKGKPVLYFHQGMGSRTHSRSMAEAAKKHKILVYKFDRPGFGHSGILPMMTIQTIGHVTEDLINHIGAKSVSAIGYGLGARTLLDVIPHTNMRIAKVAVYSFRGVLKYSSSTVMHKLSQMVWEKPTILINFLRIMRLNLSEKGIRSNLRKYYADSGADSDVLDDPRFIDERIKENEVSTRQNFAGSLFDHKNLKAPQPDFKHPSFRIPIKAIFGTDDPFNNPEDSEPYLGKLPCCEIVMSKGDGQLHIDYDFDRFLESAYKPLDKCAWLSKFQFSSIASY